MIFEVSGDILLSSAQVIAHSVAPNDPFHAGLALSLREKWPAMYKDFRHYCQTSHPKPGSIWAWAGAGEHGPVQIVALLAQDGGYEHGSRPGPAQSAHLNHALKHLATWLRQERIQSLALPRLCTGVGGMKWDAAHSLIQQHLSPLDIPVFLYTTYHKGIRASESGLLAPR